MNAHIPDATCVSLAGGVSSDIYRVDVAGRTLCVKRALSKLKVRADWQVPVDRNRYEIAWLRTAAEIDPASVPAILAEDEEAGAFAMTWLAPDRYPVWKQQLLDGELSRATAGRIGDLLGRLHASTADRPRIAEAFPTEALFRALRLDPYLVATGRAHPDLAPALDALVLRTAQTRRVLVHGDFSPKNLLVGELGPVVLDAECAWYGDPAFDVAFVLNHLLLKGARRPEWRAGYVELFIELVDAYRRHASWEDWAELERRTVALLPALMLARIDGNSPVEYLSADAVRAEVRAFARARVKRPPRALPALADAWLEHSM